MLPTPEQGVNGAAAGRPADEGEPVANPPGSG